MSASSISTQIVRVGVAGAILAGACLWGIEQWALGAEKQLTGNPHTPDFSDTTDPFLLWQLLPGATEVNGQQVHVNALGARGNAVTMEKPANIRRVVVLGDGMAFGEGVERTKSFAIDAIDSLGGERVGVQPIILAVPDYSIIQTRNLMGMRGWDLEPDLLIYSGPGIEMNVGTYVDKEVISAFRGTTPKRDILEAFATTRVADHMLRVHGGNKATQRDNVFRKGINTNTDGRPRVSSNDYSLHLDALATQAKSAEVAMVFVLLPLPTDLHDTPQLQRVAPYRMAMVDVAAKHGLPVVDGPELFQNSARDPTSLFHETGRPTVKGHRLLGYALSKALRPWMRGHTINTTGTGVTLPAYPEPTRLLGKP